MQLSVLDGFSDRGRTHWAGTLEEHVLRSIEPFLPRPMTYSAETGCGNSTVMFSRVSAEHLVFTGDDRDHPGSTVRYVLDNPMTKRETIRFILGPTQKTLPTHVFDPGRKFDCVLIDGPHGWPFPELEFYYFYPHIREGGILLVDDVQIASIGRMADIIQEDAMFELVTLTGKTAIFQRTGAETFDPFSDGWWLQNFNRRRTELVEFRLNDNARFPSFTERLRPPRTPLHRRIKRRLLRLLGY
jgi:hypothetical protein